MDFDDSLKKAVAAQQARDKLRRQAQGERTGLSDSKRRADPTRHQRTPEPKVSSRDIQHPTGTPDCISQIQKQNETSEAPNLIPESDPIRRNIQGNQSRLLNNAEEELEKIRKQLRRAYGLED
jgi:hypothetical protein